MTDRDQLEPSDARALRALVEDFRDEPLPELDHDRIERGLIQQIELEAAEKEAVDTGALDAVVADFRDEPLPELDHDRVERGLIQQIELEAARRRRRRWGGVVAAVAAAAALVIAIRGLETEPPSGRTASQPHEPARSAAPTDAIGDVEALSPESVVESGEEPVAFRLSGVVTWTLEPNSRVVVDRVTVPHEVRLERGRIEAEVIPREPGDPVEAFAVVAGNTRVAVRGTIFSVARDDETVTVAVSRGKVAVGPSDDSAEPRLMPSPSRARFSLEHGQLLEHVSGREPKLAMREEAPEEEQEAAPDGPEPPAAPAERDVTPRAAPPSPPDESPEEPRTSEAAGEEPAKEPEPREQPTVIGVGAARNIVAGCLRQALAGSSDDGRATTVSSAVTVVLGADGAVEAVRFTPPLRPDLQRKCGGTLFGQRIDGDGRVSFDIRVTR